MLNVTFPPACDSHLQCLAPSCSGHFINISGCFECTCFFFSITFMIWGDMGGSYTSRASVSSSMGNMIPFGSESEVPVVKDRADRERRLRKGYHLGRG